MIKYQQYISPCVDISYENKIKEFDTIDDMKKFLANASKSMFTINDIVIHEKEYPMETKDMVCVKRYGNEDYIEKYNSPQIIGYCWRE